MAIPYQDATSGSRALDDIQRVLTKFGCQRFGTMTDNEAGEIIVQFKYRERDILVKASVRGYAAAWLKENPWTKQRRNTEIEWDRRALAQAQISTCSILRDWIKGQITAVEVGLLSFEGAFLGQILLPTGRTVLEHVEANKVLSLPKGEA